jgi:23S rRNA (cytidine1920-2'-O)/16S rRNA (cytidine1409-2'-O)-methyltransferase
MIKPQFEVGKDRVGKGGVVRDPTLRAEAVNGIATAAAARGWGARAVTTSPLPGPSGNVEFFLWLRRGDPQIGPEEIERVVHDTVGLVAAQPAGEAVEDERLGL